MLNAFWAIVALSVGAGPASPLPERLRVLSEKLAQDIQDSRRCETDPDSGYLRCSYEYEGLRFVRVVLPRPPGEPMTWVEVESLTEGHVILSLHGYGPCVVVNVSAEEAGDLAMAHLNIRDGRVAADGRDIGCYPKDRKEQ
jgi:hypothetical protein